MGFSTFIVVLDPEQPVYIPGQAIKGYLKVGSREEVACRKITVTIKGHAKVHWSEKSGKNRRHYRADEQYFRQPAVVWNGDGRGNTMEAGDHKFRFTFILPKDIPSSFTSSFGQVIYQVKAEADRPWTLDQSHKVYFSVNHMYDLNLDRNATVPIRIQQEETGYCASGAVELNLKAQRSGYVPGENILVDGEIANNSSSSIYYTEIKLIQKITFITRSKNRKVKRTVQRVYHPRVEAGKKDIWSSVPLPIPAVPASHLQHCNIITIDYSFVLLAKMGTCSSAKAKIPIIIGSLPLQSSYSSFLNTSGTARVGGTTVTTATAAAAAAAARNSPRPHPAYPHRPSAPNAPTSLLPGPSAPSIPSTPSTPPPVPPHSPSSHAAPPYSEPPPPYNESFLPEEYRNVPPPSYASCVFGGASGYDDGADDSDAGRDYAPRYLTYKTQA